ncbi:PDZ domain-containing protein [Dyella terrae]|uniref:PDZ domain-containing protein n=1 Tax=Dyella terrae TaxID=522259 RepID=UPI001EFED370|nr:PDZ domain-containing protein [Dyella terrae]ULU27300.1 PDZ domain-containing protein [Dyella terrae]
MRRALKHLLLVAGLLLPASQALALDWFAWQSTDTLRWRSEGQYMHLATEKGGGVRVVKETPVDLWGLSAGDVILEADGKPVAHVADLVATLRAHGASPMPLKVRRNGSEQQVMLAAKARVDLLHEAPAAPPAPPALPAPPAPPGG